jgi:hypothetical protein
MLSKKNQDLLDFICVIQKLILYLYQVKQLNTKTLKLWKL